MGVVVQSWQEKGYRELGLGYTGGAGHKMVQGCHRQWRRVLQVRIEGHQQSRQGQSSRAATRQG